MSDNIREFRDDDKGFYLRQVVELENGPWFIAVDVVRSLEYSSNSSLLCVVLAYTLKNVDLRHKAIHPVSGSWLNLVDEEGVYQIMAHTGSREFRDTFKDWFANEVMPAVKGEIKKPVPKPEPKSEPECAMSIDELISEYVHCKAKTAFLMRQIRAYFQKNSQEAD